MLEEMDPHLNVPALVDPCPDEQTSFSRLPDRVAPRGVVQLAKPVRLIATLLQKVHPCCGIAVQALIVVPRLGKVYKLATPQSLTTTGQRATQHTIRGWGVQ